MFIGDWASIEVSSGTGAHFSKIFSRGENLRIVVYEFAHRCYCVGRDRRPRRPFTEFGWDIPGGSFALALGVAAALFAFELFLAAPRVLERVRHLFGEHGAVLAPLVPLFAVLIYTIGVTANWKTALLGAAYTVLPALLAATCIGKPPGQWQDYAAVLLIWLPIELRWMGRTFLYVLFPYPPQLMHTLTILLALSTGVAAFVLLRRMDGIGYAVEWRRGFAWNVMLHFAVVRRDRRGDRAAHRLSHVRAIVCAPAHCAGRGGRDFIFHCVAGGISVSRCAAEYSFTHVQESVGGAWLWRPSLSASRTFSTRLFPTGNTCFWQRWRACSTAVRGLKPDRCFPARSCTPWWIFCGTFYFAEPAHHNASATRDAAAGT